VPPRISVVVNTLNEEKNLPFALGSVRPWVDEIVVVDMHSEDRTVEIAREFGAQVFLHERMGFADPARAFALAQATGDWILVLDADEVVPFPLSRRLLDISTNDAADVVLIPWLNYILGEPLMHTMCGPRQCLQRRFFRKSHVTATSDIHNFFHVAPGSRVTSIGYEPGLAVAHFATIDIRRYIEKLNRYTTIEADQARDRGERVTQLGALIKAAKVFVTYYAIGRGYRDGWRGFYVSLISAFSEILKAAKLAESSVPAHPESVEAYYRQEAENLVKACQPSRSSSASG
jgi:glycosyltransferase involved in cell wall biosynthesis